MSVCVWWKNKTINFGAGGDAYTYGTPPTINTRSYVGVVTLESIVADMDSDLGNTGLLQNSFYNEVFLYLYSNIAVPGYNIDFSISALGIKIAEYLGLKGTGAIPYNTKATKWGSARLVFGVDSLRDNRNLIGNKRAVRDIDIEMGASNKNGDVFKSNGLLNKVEYDLTIEHLTFLESLMAVKFFRTLKSLEVVYFTDEWLDYFDGLFLTKEAQLLEKKPFLQSSDTGFNKHKISFIRVEKVDI